MRIDPTERRVELSVRELAAFRNLPVGESLGGGAWRAAVGREWHDTLEDRTRSESGEARFEVPLNASYLHRGWRFELQGRIDQLVPNGAITLIREVKTIRRALPDAAEALESHYPDYFAQAAAYLGMARVLPEFRNATLHAELVFIDIDTGTVQSVPLDSAAEERFRNQLDALIPFLEDRREARRRISELRLRPAFESLRDGQAETFETLADAAVRSRAVLLEAPTGFGKTGIVLEHALRRMREGIYERCLYLSSKSTGQIQAVEQLRRMIGGELRYIQMRNRREHRIESTLHTCTGDTGCDADLGQRWSEAGIRPMELFEDGTLTLDRAKRIGASTGVCPYALTKSCLPFAEIWIGDGNYVFSPGSRGVFESAYGFDPARTLLIVDEAHNLPGRAADALGVEVGSGDLVFALEELAAAGAPRRLVNTGNALADGIRKIPTGGAIPANARYEALDLAEDFARQLAEARFDYETAAPFALDLAWRIPELARRLGEPEHAWLHWAPQPGILRATCLDAREWIGECLRPFGGAILMSATLAPHEAFREACGLKAREAVLARGHAPWRDEAYTVAVDTRVDTRFARRDRHYADTARTIAALTGASPGQPVAAFFASYRYAENVRAYLETIDPGIRIMIQPRGVNLAEQATFIDEALLLADALFLILGSSYAEAVDQLGGRVHTAMVVGPALPEVDAVQKAKVEAHPSLSRDEAFRDVCIIPAMRRIHQALGRLVRAPGQSARILLHGKRYAEPAYRDQLAAEYAPDTVIRNEADLAEWLR